MKSSAGKFNPRSLPVVALAFALAGGRTAEAVNDQLVNHGWILGGTDRISWTAQTDIDLLLEVK